MSQTDMEVESSIVVLGYYPFRAKAQVARLLCQYLHIPYRDRFFTPDEWIQYKETQGNKMVLKDLPFLEHEGFIVTGSWAPVKYIIELSNRRELLGKTQNDRIKIDQFKNRVDLKDAMLCLVTNNRPNYNCQQKRKCIIQLYIKKIQPNLLQHEADSCQGNFYFGYLTVIDFIVYEIINHLEVMYNEGIHKLPKLVALRNRVAQIPEIKAYEESSRAVTELCPIKFFNKFKEGKINACRGLNVVGNKCRGMETE